MAKKKRRGFGKKNRAIPIAVAAPIAMPAIQYVAPKLMAGDFKGAVQSLAQEYTGLNPDGTWNPKQIAQWAIPTAIGVVIHKVASHPRVKVNGYIRKFTMGFLEL